jgi:hypothetical protein
VVSGYVVMMRVFRWEREVRLDGDLMTGASEGGGRGVTLGHEVIGLEHALDV